MPLDLFQDSIAAGDQRAARTSAPDLPATFDQTFMPAWNEGRYFGQSVSAINAREAALGDYLDDVQKKTGQDFSDIWAKDESGWLTPYLPQINARIAKVKAERPDLDLAPLSDDDLDKQAVEKSRMAREEYAEIAGREKTLGGALGSFLGSSGAGVTDPINLLAVPIAAPVEMGVLRAGLVWAGIAAGTEAAIGVAAAPYRERVQPGYAETGEDLQNIVHAAEFGFALGAGGKVLANVWTRVMTGQWPRSVRDAGNVVAGEANIEDTNRYTTVEGEAAHRTALQQQIDNLVSGRPADAGERIPPSVLANYNERLYQVMNPRARAIQAGEAAARFEREGARLPDTMERLTEQQLGDFRVAADRARAAATAAQERIAAAGPELDAARQSVALRAQELDEARSQHRRAVEDAGVAAERARNVPPYIDPATQGRLVAIEGDLARPGLSVERKTALEAERNTITESLKAGPSEEEVARQRGSLEQEAKALDKEAKRRAAAAGKAEKAHLRSIAALQRMERSARQWAVILPARAQAGLDAARVGLRKEINRLASEGYDVALPREEAEAMAAGIIEAPDRAGADAQIHGVTEALVDRRLEKLKANPPELPFGQQAPGAAERAASGHWTEQMRRGITALAREVGYVMPREEAVTIAAEISRMPEDQALAVLDEVLLRPRTVADTLPGTAARAAQEARAEQIAAEAERLLRGAPELPEPAPGIVPEPARVPDITRPEMTPAVVRKTLESPEAVDAQLADLDRFRAMGDKQIPTGVDAKGEPVYRSLDDILDGIEADRKAADEIAACVTPVREAAE